MLRDPVYREAVKHRQAAVADSRLIRLAPATPGLDVRRGRVSAGVLVSPAKFFPPARSLKLAGTIVGGKSGA